MYMYIYMYICIPMIICSIFLAIINTCCRGGWFVDTIFGFQKNKIQLYFLDKYILQGIIAPSEMQALYHTWGNYNGLQNIFVHIKQIRNNILFLKKTNQAAKGIISSLNIITPCKMYLIKTTLISFFWKSNISNSFFDWHKQAIVVE